MSKNSNNNVIGEKRTFWELTAEYAIVVPIIQRDYAQGRETDDVRQIRDKFVKKLLGRLQNKTPILLDFVYGTLEKAKSLSDQTTKYTEFIPLDGQQRLTTLFLLHWFLSLWNHEEGKDDYEDFKSHMIIDKNISKFNYRTRTSSGDFCKNLISKSNRELVIKNIKDEITNPVSSAIIDEGWFHYSWKYDPTISGMLVMLDTICKIFPNENRETKAHEYYVGLTIERLVSFNLLYLNKSSQENDQHQESVITTDDRFSDELYIKMNSRGKPLSDFEIFKSRFEAFLRKFTDIDVKDFSQKIDHKWADSLWSIRNKVMPNDADAKYYTRDNTDQMMMNLINVVMANTYALTDDTQEEGLNVVFQTGAGKKRNYDLHLTFYRYTELGILNEKNDGENNHMIENCLYGQSVRDTFAFVHDFISNPSLYETTSILFDGEECLNKVLFDSIDGKQSKYNSISYDDRLYFYSFSQFSIISLIPLGPSFNQYLNRWMHFVVNIIESAEINDVYDMQKFLKVISGILSYFKQNKMFDIVEYLNGISKYPDWSPVPSTQVREEILKAKLISRNNNWEDIILKGDSIRDWPGRSGYLLYYTGLSTIKDSELNSWSPIDHQRQIEIYKGYYDKMLMLLEVVSDEKHNSEHLFERLLLSRSNYMRYENYEYNDTYIYSMMNSGFKGRSYSWRQMLQYNGIPDENGIMANDYNAGVDTLKQVLDTSELEDATDTNSMYSAIMKLIKKPVSPIEMWRKQMLEEPELWGLSQDHFFWLGKNGDAWVPRKTNFNTNHYEVKSYRLYLKLKKQCFFKYYPHEGGYIFFRFKQKGSDNNYGFWIKWNQTKSSWNLKVTPMDANLNALPSTIYDLKVLRTSLNSIEINALNTKNGITLSDKKLSISKEIQYYYNKISSNFDIV